MSLQIYNAANCGKVQSTKEPRVSMNSKTGYIYLNRSLCLMVGLSRGDKISLAHDPKENKWFMVKNDKKDTAAFELKSYDKAGKPDHSLKITSRALVTKIIESQNPKKVGVGGRGNIHLFGISPDPVSQAGFITYLITPYSAKS